MYVIISVSRQIDGEHILVRVEKAMTKATKAEEFLNQKRKELKNPDGSLKPVVISTPHGDVECMTEIGVFQVELEDDETT